MDKEIAELRRRAGLNEETFDMASFEKLNEFLVDEIEFLGKLGNVLGRAMAPDRARDVLKVIQDRRQRLTQFGRQAQTQFRSDRNKAKQKQAGEYADTEQPGAQQSRSYGKV